jgi:antirestriction protein ArdC
MSGIFGSAEYAKEELRAEIGALFTEADLGISLKGEHYEDHSDYLRSWIGVLENDYNEFFRACADAEQIAKRLVGNYTKKYELKMEVEGLPEQDVLVTEPEKRMSGRSR